VISDICMPDEDGYSLIQQLRTLELTQGWQVPVIAVSAYTHSEARDHAMIEGFDGYLSKPVLASELVSMITRLLRGNQQHYGSQEFQNSPLTNQLVKDSW
jgi:two-component system, OmpR family, response regulator